MKQRSYAIVGTVFAAGVVFAAEVPDFTTVDKDRNGYVSRDESRAVPQILELFSRVDANQDGQLSSVEYSEAVKLLS